MSCSLQHTKGDQTAGQMMQLSPLGTRLTASQPELILAHTDDFLDLCPPPIDAADFGGRQGQTIRRIVLGAVSGDQDFQPTCEPAGLRPIGMAPIGPKGLAIEAAVLLETADAIPAIVPNPLQEGFRGIPGIEEAILRATAQIDYGPR